MSTAREIAIEVLPHFERNVLERRVLSYGVYANAIGRDPAKDSMSIGQAMHAIGGACVLLAIPVAPLYFVKRSDDHWRGVFEADPAESQHVLPHYDLLYVSARMFKYSSKDFQRIDRALREILPKHLRPDQLSPHDIWHLAIYTSRPDGTTSLIRALNRYREILAEIEAERSRS
jgi:hypothetical protein